MISRRRFIQTATAFTSISVLPTNLCALDSLSENRMFTLCLNTGNIGVEASQHELFNMAVKHGFEAISVYASSLSDMSTDEIKAQWQGLTTQ